MLLARILLTEPDDWSCIINESSLRILPTAWTNGSVISGILTVANSIPIVLVPASPRTFIPKVWLPDNINSAVEPPSSFTVASPTFNPENLTFVTTASPSTIRWEYEPVPLELMLPEAVIWVNGWSMLSAET